jgi:hypothetical protein
MNTVQEASLEEEAEGPGRGEPTHIACLKMQRNTWQVREGVELTQQSVTLEDDSGSQMCSTALTDTLLMAC